MTTVGTTAIHTVFIAKENIYFMEEWIDYHIRIGFDKFYLYNNSKVNSKSTYLQHNPHFKPGKVNKYKINYDEIVKLTDEEIDEKLKNIAEKYKEHVHIYDWAPKNKEGKIMFAQTDAARHVIVKKLKKNNIDWCANIDMDEYIVIKEHDSIKNYIKELSKKIKNLSNIKLSQQKFESRFLNMDKQVIEINRKEKTTDVKDGTKNIYKVERTRMFRPTIHDWRGRGEQFKSKSKGAIWFNHYNKNKFDNLIIKNNIRKSIKQTVLEDTKNFIQFNKE